MKVHNIEIEDGPFREEYLDDCYQKIDVIVDIHLATDTPLFETIRLTFEAIEDEGVGKIVFIHHYPKELLIIFGIKIIGPIPG